MGIDWLFERMASFKEKRAIVSDEEAATYGQLLEMVTDWQTYFKENDIQTGQVVAIYSDYTPKSCALLLALIDHGAICVPLTKGIQAHYDEFLEIAEVEVVLTSHDNEDWVVHKPDVAASNPLILDLRAQGEPGLVVFSSGSTGKNKGILHSFTYLLDKFKIQRHSLCTITFLTFDHMGGINTLLYTLSNGGMIVSVSGRDPEIICQAIERYGVELLPVSPTFLNLLLISHAYERYDLSSLKLISYGTEVMPESTLQQMHRIFANIRLQQTYGLSELGVLRSRSRESGSLWVKVGGEGFKTKVVDGKLWIKAHSSMLGYLNAPSPFDEEGWLNTGDLVEVDGEYVRFLGRESEIINVGGEKVFPAEVENVILQIENIKDVVVRGKSSPITGNIVLARVTLFEPEDPFDLEDRVLAFCETQLAPYKVPALVQIVSEDLHNQRFKKVRVGRR
ncbi:MAG: ANL family adenylate-forming protein [Ardenticatenaceae bacterium]